MQNEKSNQDQAQEEHEVKAGKKITVDLVFEEESIAVGHWFRVLSGPLVSQSKL